MKKVQLRGFSFYCLPPLKHLGKKRKNKNETLLWQFLVYNQFVFPFFLFLGCLTERASVWVFTMLLLLFPLLVASIESVLTLLCIGPAALRSFALTVIGLSRTKAMYLVTRTVYAVVVVFAFDAARQVRCGALQCIALR